VRSIEYQELLIRKREPSETRNTRSLCFTRIEMAVVQSCSFMEADNLVESILTSLPLTGVWRLVICMLLTRRVQCEMFNVAILVSI